MEKWQILYLRTRYRSKLGWFFWFGSIHVTMRRNLAEAYSRCFVVVYESSGIITANQNKTSYKWYKSQEEDTCHMQEVYSAYLQSSLNKDTALCSHATGSKVEDWKELVDMTSTQKGEGGLKIPQIHGKTVQYKDIADRGERGSKIQKICGRDVYGS